MVQTRAQKNGHVTEPSKTSSKQSQMKSGAVAGRKRKSEKEAKHATADQMSSAHTPKRQRQEKAVENTPPTSSEDKSNGSDKSLKARVDNVLSKYGEPPLKGLVNEKLPASQFVLAHILNALLSSTRISHTLAAKTLSCLVDENYHDIHVLHKTSWQERTEVLTAGGFTHYREKTATYLGDLAELIKTKYGKSLRASTIWTYALGNVLITGLLRDR